ncbi:MAG: hypothetical protein MUF61_01350 [archaeon]|jgi:hypothetical protein|nr:hypothetical protein [archaeon]
MNLDGLAEFLIKKEQEIKEELKERTRALSLQDVTREIKLEPRSCDYEDFKDGDTLQFNVGKNYGHPCAFYHVELYREVLVLETFGPRRVIVSFRGKKVEDFYKKLSAAIIKAQEEGAHKLPF